MVNEALEVWQTEDWNDIYLAVLVEGHQEKFSFSIREAECTIIERARQLFEVSGDIFDGGEGLNDAVYALRWLKSCL